MLCVFLDGRSREGGENLVQNHVGRSRLNGKLLKV